jgi:hypothetical protein
MFVPLNKFDLMPDKDDDVKNFVPATLSDRDGDLSKRWYVYYKVWDAAKNELVKKQVYVPAEFKTEKERRKWGLQTVKEINKLLNEGYVINAEGTKEVVEPQSINIKDAVDKYIRDSKSILRHRSWISGKNCFEMFLRYCTDKNIHKQKLSSFTKQKPTSLWTGCCQVELTTMESKLPFQEEPIIIIWLT